VKVFQLYGSHHFLENTESLLPTVQVAYNSYNDYYSVKCEGRAAVSAAVSEGSINPFKGFTFSWLLLAPPQFFIEVFLSRKMIEIQF
jgi:hypothetical protein